MRMQAALSSMICFSLGGAVPLLAGAFIKDPKWRLLIVILASTAALAVFGAVGKFGLLASCALDI